MKSGKNKEGAGHLGKGREHDAPTAGNDLRRDAIAGEVMAEPWSDREEFRERVHQWARKLEVKAHSIYIRPMSRKWASCSTKGTLTFNDELLRMDQDLGDYVIVHELLHCSVPNHGKLWKALMRAHLGDWEVSQARLNRLA